MKNLSEQQQIFPLSRQQNEIVLRTPVKRTKKWKVEPWRHHVVKWQTTAFAGMGVCVCVCVCVRACVCVCARARARACVFINFVPSSFPGGTSGKEPTCRCRRQKRCRSIPGSRRSPGRWPGKPLQPVLLSGESQGQRSLVGYSP